MKDPGSPFVPIGKRMLMLLVAVSLIWLLAAIAWHYAKPLLIRHFVPESYRLLIGEMPTAPQKPKVMLKGNMNGIPLVIPRQYIEFPVEYNDKSIWEARKPDDKTAEQRTFDDAISAFSLYVRWPEMKSRWDSQDMQDKFWKERQGGEHPWLSIGVTAWNATARGRELGFATVLRGNLERLSARPQNRYLPSTDIGKSKCSATERSELVSVHYELRGIDSVTGLQWAEPVGPGTECFETWNQTLYWHGDMDGLVTDLIECYNGELRGPKAYPICIHRFELPSWGAEVSVTYPRTWLARWRETKAGTRSLVLGLHVPSDNISSNTNTTVQPIINDKTIR